MLTLIAIMMVSCSSNEELGAVSVADPSIVGDAELNSCFQVVSATPITLVVEQGQETTQLSSQYIFAKTSVKIKCLKEYDGDCSLSLLLLDENGSPLYERYRLDRGDKFYIFNNGITKKLDDMKVGEERTFPIQVRIREELSLREGVVNDETVKEEILKTIKMVSLKNE